MNVSDMRCYINGEEKEVKSGLDLGRLLDSLNVQVKSVIVEYNEKVVPFSEVNHIKVSEGDKIEIVRFVGGG